MFWVDFGGQEVAGFDYIGTEDLKYPITKEMDVEHTLEEIKRRCGRWASVKLYKKEENSNDR